MVFSEAVSGFTAADLAFTGSTTGGTLAGVLTPVGSDNITWTVAVSGMSHNGDVVVSLASAAAQDAVGNSSAASTSTDNTVTYNPTISLALTTGWNLVAAAPGTSFPGGLWAWEGGSFQSVLDPVAWNGYWYKSATDQNVDMYTVEGPKTFDLTDDWNLIGNSMATPATVTVPQGSGLVVWAWVVVRGHWLLPVGDHPAARPGRLGEGYRRSAADADGGKLEHIERTHNKAAQGARTAPWAASSIQRLWPRSRIRVRATRATRGERGRSLSRRVR